MRVVGCVGVGGVVGVVGVVRVVGAVDVIFLASCNYKKQLNTLQKSSK